MKTWTVLFYYYFWYDAGWFYPWILNMAKYRERWETEALKYSWWEWYVPWKLLLRFFHVGFLPCTIPRMQRMYFIYQLLRGKIAAVHLPIMLCHLFVTLFIMLKLRLLTAINRANFVSRWMWFNGSPTKVQRHFLTNAFCYLRMYITCTKIRNRTD